MLADCRGCPHVYAGRQIPARADMQGECFGRRAAAGLYRVPEGTTQFEILKWRACGHVGPFRLQPHAGVGDNSDINVGTRDTAVSVKPAQLSARIEFFYGDVMVTAPEGQSPARAGLGCPGRPGADRNFKPGRDFGGRVFAHRHGRVQRPFRSTKSAFRKTTEQCLSFSRKPARAGTRQRIRIKANNTAYLRRTSPLP